MGFGLYFLVARTGAPGVPAWVAAVVLIGLSVLAAAVTFTDPIRRGRGVARPSRAVAANYGGGGPLAGAGWVHLRGRAPAQRPPGHHVYPHALSLKPVSRSRDRERVPLGEQFVPHRSGVQREDRSVARQSDPGGCGRHPDREVDHVMTT